MTDAFRNYWPVAVLLGLVALLGGCATTFTQNRAEDGSTQTLVRFELGGRILNHGATTEYTGTGWAMRAGDTVQQMDTDPEVTRAAVAGAIEALRMIP